MLTGMNIKDISELPEELLNILIFAWDKRDEIYNTIK
jgi:hypothetical protein